MKKLYLFILFLNFSYSEIKSVSVSFLPTNNTNVEVQDENTPFFITFSYDTESNAEYTRRLNLSEDGFPILDDAGNISYLYDLEPLENITSESKYVVATTLLLEAGDQRWTASDFVVKISNNQNTLTEVDVYFLECQLINTDSSELINLELKFITECAVSEMLHNTLLPSSNEDLRLHPDTLVSVIVRDSEDSWIVNSNQILNYTLN